MTDNKVVDVVLNNILSVVDLADTQDRRDKIKFCLQLFSDLQSMEHANFLLRKAQQIEDEETRHVISSLASDIKGVDAKVHAEQLGDVLAMKVFRLTNNGSSYDDYKQASDQQRAHCKVVALDILVAFNLYLSNYRREIENKSVEFLRFAFKNREVGHFDPELIEQYKTQVLFDFLDLMISGACEE